MNNRKQVHKSGIVQVKVQETRNANPTQSRIMLNLENALDLFRFDSHEVCYFVLFWATITHVGNVGNFSATG